MNEHGSGTVLGVALLGPIVLASGAALAGLAVLAAQSQLQGTADSAALAAADTLSGRALGFPCENGDRAAGLGGASLAECHTDGLIAAVTVSQSWSGFELTARARAGPPGAR